MTSSAVTISHIGPNYRDLRIQPIRKLSGSEQKAQLHARFAYPDCGSASVHAREDGTFVHDGLDARSLQHLTKSQLHQYRRELERCLKGISEKAPVRELIERKLAAILAEQQARIEA
jgi:hypothetical protein